MVGFCQLSLLILCWLIFNSAVQLLLAPLSIITLAIICWILFNSAFLLLLALCLSSPLLLCWILQYSTVLISFCWPISFHPSYYVEWYSTVLSCFCWPSVQYHFTTAIMVSDIQQSCLAYVVPLSNIISPLPLWLVIFNSAVLLMLSPCPISFHPCHYG